MCLWAQVLAAEAAALARKERHAAATEWVVLPWSERGLLVVATVLMVAACYMVQLLVCFQPYELTSKIRDLPGGMWWVC